MTRLSGEGEAEGSDREGKASRFQSNDISSSPPVRNDMKIENSMHILKTFLLYKFLQVLYFTTNSITACVGRGKLDNIDTNPSLFENLNYFSKKNHFYHWLTEKMWYFGTVICTTMELQAGCCEWNAGRSERRERVVIGVKLRKHPWNWPGQRRIQPR